MKKIFTWIRVHPIITTAILVVCLVLGAVIATWIVGAPYRKGMVIEKIPSSLGRN